MGFNRRFAPASARLRSFFNGQAPLSLSYRFSPGYIPKEHWTQDIEIGGHAIKAGDYVVMAYASANRDEDVWERPDEFDVTRSFDHDHQGFGYGEHSCPGALLARTDSTVIQERLLARFPDWELAGAPVRWANPFIQGMTSVPLRFSP